MNKITELLFIPFSLMILYIINTGFISTSYAQIFEFDEEDYYENEEEEKIFQLLQKILKIHLPQILKI